MFENIKADIRRLGHPKSWWIILRGLLSQGFQAILVYRVFHWLREKKYRPSLFALLSKDLLRLQRVYQSPLNAGSEKVSESIISEV